MSYNHPVMNFSNYKYPERPEANTIEVPIRPSKHNSRQPTPENWRKYADELEEYQKKKEEFNK